MPLRPVASDDAGALAPFVGMAAFAPGERADLEMPHARRRLGGLYGLVW